MGTRVVIALLSLSVACSLTLKPDVPVREPRVPAKQMPSSLLGLPHPQRARPKRHLERTPLEYWREVTAKPTPAGLQLTVSPLVGLAPLAVRITLRLPAPKPEDRELELTAWDAADEDMAAPLFRTTRDVFWQQAALRGAQNQPDFVALPQTLQAHWRLPAGSLLIVGCVWPRAQCVGQRVVVS